MNEWIQEQLKSALAEDKNRQKVKRNGFYFRGTDVNKYWMNTKVHKRWADLLNAIYRPNKNYEWILHSKTN